MHCIACEGTKFDRTWLGLQCAGCGLTKHEVTTDSYEGDFFGTVADDYYRSYVARAGQWRHEARARLRWVRRRHEPRRLLELGSAAGYFLEAANAAGIEAVGVEPSRDVAAYAQGTLGVDVHIGTFETVDLPHGFDTICAWHVLEHIVDPLAFLEKARSHLERGGLVALEVPNAASSAAVRQGQRWSGWMLEHHIWHHTPVSLSLLAQRAGLTVEDAEIASESAYARWNLDGLRVVRRRLLHGGGDFLRLVARREATSSA
jgi:2-polyprenyl-3-methyl-5-hydroxy-6-metoxy-1,4-benzoquinol methylase